MEKTSVDAHRLTQGPPPPPHTSTAPSNPTGNVERQTKHPDGGDASSSCRSESDSRAEVDGMRRNIWLSGISSETGPLRRRVPGKGTEPPPPATVDILCVFEEVNVALHKGQRRANGWRHAETERGSELREESFSCFFVFADCFLSG